MASRRATSAIQLTGRTRTARTPARLLGRVLHREELDHPLFRVHPAIARRNQTRQDIAARLHAHGEKRLGLRRDRGGLAKTDHPRWDHALRMVLVEKLAQRMIRRQFKNRHRVQIAAVIDEVECHDARRRCIRRGEAVVNANHLDVLHRRARWRRRRTGRGCRFRRLLSGGDWSDGREGRHT